jgi:hypothetical protein
MNNKEKEYVIFKINDEKIDQSYIEALAEIMHETECCTFGMEEECPFVAENHDKNPWSRRAHTAYFNKAHLLIREVPIPKEELELFVSAWRKADELKFKLETKMALYKKRFEYPLIEI